METVNKLQELLSTIVEFVNQSAEPELANKLSPEKWSKKEILGHLVDSGINNLQRFTKTQFEDQPYQIRKYNQDELVRANNYQYADLQEIMSFLLAINTRIMSVMQQQTDQTLGYVIIIDQEQRADLRFLIQDYVDHFEHHVK